MKEAGVEVQVPRDIDFLDPRATQVIERVAKLAKAYPRNDQNRADPSKPKSTHGGTLTTAEIDALLAKATIKPLRQHQHGATDKQGLDVGDLLKAIANNLRSLKEKPEHHATRDLILRLARSVDPSLPTDPIKAFARLRVRYAQGLRFNDQQLAAIDAIANGLYISTGDYKPRTAKGRKQTSSYRKKPTTATQSIIDAQNRMVNTPKTDEVPTQERKGNQTYLSGREKMEYKRLRDKLRYIFESGDTNAMAELVSLGLGVRSTRKGKLFLNSTSVRELMEVLAAPDKDTGEVDQEAVKGSIVDGRGKDTGQQLADIAVRTADDNRSDRVKAIRKRVGKALRNGEISGDAKAFVDEYLKLIGWKKSRIADTSDKTKIVNVLMRIADDYDKYVYSPVENNRKIDLDMAEMTTFNVLEWFGTSISTGNSAGLGGTGEHLKGFATALREYVSDVLAARGIDVTGSEVIQNLEDVAAFGTPPRFNLQTGVNEAKPTEGFDRSILRRVKKLNLRQRNVLRNYLMPTRTQMMETPELAEMLNNEDYRGIINYLVDGGVIPFNNSFEKFMRDAVDYNSTYRISSVLKFIRGDELDTYNQPRGNARKDAGPIDIWSRRIVNGVEEIFIGENLNADKFKKPETPPAPKNESVPIYLNVRSPEMEDGSNEYGIPSQFHVLGFVSSKLEGKTIEGNFAVAVRDIVMDALVDLVTTDARVIGATITVSPTVPDSTIVYRNEDGREYTWGEIRKEAAEHENRLSSATNTLRSKHRFFLQNQKVEAIRQMEKFLKAFATAMFKPDGSGQLTDLGESVIRSLSAFNKEVYDQTRTNMRRLLAQMYRATYGEDNKHLDVDYRDLDVVEQNLRDNEGLLAFTEADIDLPDWVEALAQSAEAEREEAKNSRRELKAQGDESTDYTISGDSINLDKLDRVLRLLNQKLGEGFNDTGEVFTAANVNARFEEISSARRGIKEIESSFDEASKLDDLISSIKDSSNSSDIFEERADPGVWRPSDRLQQMKEKETVKRLDDVSYSPEPAKSTAQVVAEVRDKLASKRIKRRKLDPTGEIAAQAELDAAERQRMAERQGDLAAKNRARLEATRQKRAQAEKVAQEYRDKESKRNLNSGTGNHTRRSVQATLRSFSEVLKKLFTTTPDGKQQVSLDKVIQVAADGLFNAMQVNQGDTLKITYDASREVSIVSSEYRDDGSIEYTINLTPLDKPLKRGDTSIDPRTALARGIAELSHELAHLVARPDDLSKKDFETLMNEYATFLATHPNVDANYTMEEYLADKVASVLMARAGQASSEILSEGTVKGLAHKLAGIIHRIMSIAHSMLNTIFPNRDFRPVAPESAMGKVVDRLLNSPARLSGSYFFEGAPKNGVQQVKALAGKAIDNKLANFFKPVARRLQNIDRMLARMFYTPPGAKNASRTAGLMDEAIHRRKVFVQYIRTQYPNDKDFNADYNDFISSGKPSKKLDNVFRVMQAELTKINAKSTYQGVPVMFLPDDIAARKTELRKLLTEVKDNDAAWNSLVDDFISSFDGRSAGYDDTQIRPGNPLGTAQPFKRLRDEAPEIIPMLKREGFIRESSAGVLNSFIGGVATRIEFERLFGAVDVNEEGKAFWNPSKKLSDRLTAISDLGKRKEAIRTIHSMLGFDAHKIRPAWRIFNDWAVTLTSWAVLPFSGFASIPDLIMPFIRNRTWSGAFKGMANVTRMMATNPARVKAIIHAYSLASSSIHDTIWSQMASNNAFINKTPGALSTALFKFNGLELITKTSRNLAAVLAIDTILDMASRTDNESMQLLNELGLTRDQAIAIKKYMDTNDAVPVFDPNATDEHNALADAASRAVTIFTNESVIHPNKGQVAAVMNDPRYRIFTLLKPFLYGFGAIIYGGNYREMRRRFTNSRDLGDAVLNSPMIMSPLILAFALMMPMAALGLELREMLRDMLAGDDTYSARLRKLSTEDYLKRSFTRAGGAGYLEIPMMIMDGWEWGQSYGEKSWNAAVRTAGPVAGVADQIRKDIQNENRTLPRLGVWDPNSLVK